MRAVWWPGLVTAVYGINRKSQLYMWIGGQQVSSTDEQRMYGIIIVL
jgi:hypothetical protein